MREMKDSGIEWIGKIPKEWGIVKFKYLHNGLNTGEAIDKEYWESDAGLNAFYTAGLTPIRTGYSNFPTWKETGENDLLLARNGTPYVYLPVSKAYYTDHIIRAAMSSLVNRRFIRYCLQQSIASIAVDSVSIPTWSATLCNNQILTWPSVIEQERIAAFLDAECAEIDAVLEKTRASIEEYKKLKQAVITQAVTKGVRGDRPMKDSGIEWIGDIPAEWDVVRQKYFWNTVESGVSVNAADKPVDNSEQYGVLKTSSVSKFVFIPTEHKQVNLEEYGRVSCPVRADSIIASRMNTPELVGACGYVQNNYPNLFLPDRLWQITFKDGLSPKYAWYYLSGIRVRQYISSLSTGTSSSMQNISQSQYGNIFVTIPSIGEQSEITKYLDEKCRFVDALVTKKQQYLTEIENYKKSLIYEYVTGKKEVV